ncbi:MULTISPECIES: ankyrin repeat domain-containing protein [Tessaracoccus]|uniref:ankyrin repeat domain-containing protein n=1 Tax=Tessaracoccus TaxID=72763 RepID=UPI00099DCAA6|nr:MULTISPECIES: ankyrin repeat domain-containing protein [Tessaracoccus]AQX15816.1 hypothetical protein BKM78_07720 [Tessaracoccus sp. T2.5-30]
MTWGETLRDQLDFYWAVHLRPRLAGLTDDEYWWEPADGAWTLRPDADGALQPESLPVEPPVPPVTTIAWRIAHVGRDVLGKRARAFFGDPSLAEGALPADDTIMFDARWWPEPLPATADGALALLERAYVLWRDGVAALDDDALLQPLGPKGEHHADQSMAELVMHINREVIAHGAEICLLRDLYRAQRDARDPVVAAVRRGDAGEVSRLLDGGAAVPPSLVVETAGLRHWDAVRVLVEHDAAVDVGNPSALHYAAAAGELESVELLLKHGADSESVDAQFGMTPAVWADHFGHTDVAAHLRNQPGSTASST